MSLTHPNDDIKKELYELYKSVFKSSVSENHKEKELMYSWNLTAKTILHTNEWKNLFLQTKYTGDFYWFKP